jgi:7-cyano-7-deazaguanine synthase
MERKYDLVLLFSGGYDSTLLLEMALEMKKSVLCVLVNYGQDHVEELKMAQQYCVNKMVDMVTVSVIIPVASNLTADKKTYQGVSQWHVPSRNLIFISLAASIAESRDIPLIWYGANYEDRDHLFPDCYQEWVYELNKLLAINGSCKLVLEAPLLGMSKDTIKILANHFGISNEQVFSGYGK